MGDPPRTRHMGRPYPPPHHHHPHHPHSSSLDTLPTGHGYGHAHMDFYTTQLASDSRSANGFSAWDQTHPDAPPLTPATPLGLSGPVGSAPCQWAGCTVQLDDLSHPGIRRHFRTHHPVSRGQTVHCTWGGPCRSEPMLFENIPKHIAECHLKSMAQQCPTCGNTFARKDTLKRHQTAGCPAQARAAQAQLQHELH